MPTAQQQDPQEAALRTFLAGLPDGAAVPLRTLAHAWVAAGGRLQPGKMSCRLLAQGRAPFTAATLFGNQAGHPTLEIARVVLQTNGVDAAAWQAWADEHAELRSRGFDPAAKYVVIRLDGLVPADLARLVTGLRDLLLLVPRVA